MAGMILAPEYVATLRRNLLRESTAFSTDQVKGRVDQHEDLKMTDVYLQAYGLDLLAGIWIRSRPCYFLALTAEVV